MKRMFVPATLALGLAFALVRPASAGHLMDGLRHRGKGCCEPAPACEPCKPACPKPKCFSLRPSCPKPCEPACPDPCNGGHKLGGKIRGMFSRFGHKNSCEPCSPCNGGNGTIIMDQDHAPAPAPAPAPMPAGQTRLRYESDNGPRLTPIPTNTTRSIRRSNNSF